MEREIARWLEPALGIVLIAIVLIDVFLTVLYARLGTGLLSPRLNRAAWQAMRWIAARVPSHQPVILSFGGPLVLVSLLLAWALLLTTGAAAVVHPALGTDVRSSSGPSDTDFVTALYVAGNSMSIVGGSDYEPQTGGYRLVFLFDSLVGVTMASLAITYLMQVYNAVRTSNNAGLRLHLESGETGDAAELIASWAPRGQFNAGYTDLSNVAAHVADIKESHHFYPVLFYFRFPEVHYSVARIALLALDALALLRCALIDEDEHAWIKSSAAAKELQCASNLLLSLLGDHYVAETPGLSAGDDPGRRNAWKERYRRGLERLRAAGIATRSPADDAGAQRYVEQREQWDRRVCTLAATLGFRIEDVDPAGHARVARAVAA
jgi:hypothetical protein